MNAYALGWKRFFDVKGRSCRKELWMWYIINFLIGSVLFAVPFIVSGLTAYSKASNGGFMDVLSTVFSSMGFGIIPWCIFTIAAGIGLFTVQWRRLHDRGHSFGFFFIYLIPIVGPLILFVVLYFMPSIPNDNKYGPVPKCD